jgi:hypothetical protein
MPLSAWIRNRIELVTGRNGRRLRRRRATPLSIVAAQVETLESRKLLTVTFHGGALLANVEAQLVYLGSAWQSNAALQTQKAQLEGFTATVVNSNYMDMLTNAGYRVGRGTSSAGVVYNIGIAQNTTLTQTQVQTDLQAMLSNPRSGLQAPDANRLYVIYVEPGVAIQLGTQFSNKPDANGSYVLGYHGAFAGRTASGQAADIHYAVIVHPGTPNQTSGFFGFSSDINQMTSTASHEIAEAATDPNVNYKALGWYDDANRAEIGDLTGGNREILAGTNYLVQDLVDQNDHLISPNTIQQPPTLTAPAVSAVALSPTTGQLSWNAVSGAQGYRVFWWNGSQAVQIGSYGSSTTSVQISNLAPNSTSYFKVEAYSGSQVADSAWVGITTHSLAAPQASVWATSRTTATLAWTPVSGAQGYRIFWWNGSQAVQIGSFGASTTSVNITNLTPGRIAYFKVEAYAGNQVADSAWVSEFNPAALGHAGADLITTLAAANGAVQHTKRDIPVAGPIGSDDAIVG